MCEIEKWRAITRQNNGEGKSDKDKSDGDGEEDGEEGEMEKREVMNRAQSGRGCALQ